MNSKLIFLGIIICVSALGCKSLSSGNTRAKQVIQVDTKSMSLEELNDWLQKTYLAAVTDLATNRTAIIREGVLIDSWPSVTGALTEGRFSRSLTRLGVFTMDAIDYCPPWYPGNGEVYTPCSEDNRLGRYSIWFDRYLYGFHGRHEKDQSEFTRKPSMRSRSAGCVVAPHEKLREYADLIFEHPAFKDHVGVEEIKRIRDHSDPAIRDQNKLILLEDYKGNRSPPPPDGGQPLGERVKIDAKLLVIDIRDLGKWSTKTERDSLFLRTEKEPGTSHTSMRLSRSCLVQSPLPLYQDPSLISEQYEVGTLNPGDLLVGFHHLPHFGSTGGWVQLKTQAGQSVKGWLVYQDGEQSMNCDKDYSWFSSPEARVVSLYNADTQNDSPSCSLAELTQQENITQTKAYKLLNCLKWGGGLGCQDKHRCVPLWGEAKTCFKLFEWSQKYLEVPLDMQEKICGS